MATRPLIDLLYDSLFQTIILGPLSSIVVGAIAAMLAGKRRDGPVIATPADSDAPTRRSENSRLDDTQARDMALSLIAAIAGTWAYLAYHRAVVFGILAFSLCTFGFALGALAVARERGRIGRAEAVRFLLLSAVVLFVAIWANAYAQYGVHPDWGTYAREQGPLRLFLEIAVDIHLWSLPLQLTGVIFLGLVQLTFICQTAHFAARALSGKAPIGVMARFTAATAPSVSGKWLVRQGCAGVTAVFLLSGVAHELVVSVLDRT